MADKTHLEESLEFLINEENEKAVSSFHKFIVGSARAIHESLMENDELDDEINEDDSDEKEVKEEEKVEEGMNEYFGDNDLDEVDDEVAVDDAAIADLDGDVDADEFGDEEAEETVEVPVDDLADLQAKFDVIMADAGLGGEDLAADEFGGEDLAADEFGGEDEVEENRFSSNTNPFAEGKEDDDDDAVTEEVSHDSGVVADGNDGADADGKSGGGSDSVKHNADAKLPESYDFDLTEEDFLDLEEGLKAVSVSMGGEQGGVKFAGEETNTKSTVADKDKSDVKASPKSLNSKQKEHGDYKREAAPSNDKLPHSGENNHDKAAGTPGRSTVAGHGGPESTSKQGGEQGGKKFAGTEVNTKSTLGSAGSKSEK